MPFGQPIPSTHIRKVMGNMISRIFIRAIFISTILVLLSVSIPITPVKGIGVATMPYPMFQKGMCYVTWSKDSFELPSSDRSLKSMADAGVKSVSIVVTWYQEKYNSTEMTQTDRTPSDSSVRHAIRKAHEYGMNVMLKPHIDLISEDGNSRSDIGFNSPEKWKAWFSNYLRFITHYALIAREENVEFFCIGTELAFAATQTIYWEETLIPETRKVFPGQIVYAANWDEYSQVEFWDELDYIGIDSYFPLSNKDNPPLDELRAGWKKWLAEIESVQKKYDKPVIFTESGYCSADSAARKPWEEAMSGNANTALQADCYRALLETFWDKPWFYGIYWWSWNTYAGSGGNNNKKFTPQNKPALEDMKLWYNQYNFGDKLVFNSKWHQNINDSEIPARLATESARMKQAVPRGIAVTGELSGRPQERPKNISEK